MVKLLYNLCGGKDKKSVDGPPPPEAPEARCSLHKTLTHSAFTRFYSTWGLGLVLFVKIIVIPGLYIYAASCVTNDQKKNDGLMIYWILGMMFYCFALFANSICVQLHHRYKKKKFIVKLCWWHYYKVLSFYAFFFETLLLVVFPITLYFADLWTLPQIVIGLILTLVNILALYNYHYADFLPFMKPNKNLILYECYEEAYGPMQFSILDCTPTCITLKNIGTENLAHDISVARVVDDIEVPFHETICENDRYLTPGSTLKIVTTEFTGDLGNNGIRLPKIRSFGFNKGHHEETIVRMKGGSETYCVTLIRNYESKWFNDQRKCVIEALKKKELRVIIHELPSAESADLPV